MAGTAISYDRKEVHPMVEQIYRRKSVRKYRQEPIPADVAQMLLSWRDWVHPFKDRLTIDNHIRRLPGDAHIRGMFLIKAPAYMLYTSQQTPLARLNCGFILEQVSLGMSMLGVGTCFMGAAHADAQHLKSLRFPPMMMMSYGMPDEPLTRDISQFKRKSMEQICTGDMDAAMREVVESARLAPSAMNRQPWRFVVSGSDVHCYVARVNVPALKQLSEVDMGIALSHMYLTVTERGGRALFAHRAGGADKAPRGAEYVTTLTVS